jgi:hypothetical protein
MAEDHDIGEPVITDSSLDGRASFLEELPPELLHRIFEYTLPHGFTFNFRREGDSWDVFAARGNHIQWVIGKKPTGHYRTRKGRRFNDACTVCVPATDCKEIISQDEMQMELLFVNKAFAREAKGKPLLSCLSHTKAV